MTIFQSSFRFAVKLRRKDRSFPNTLPPTASPRFQYVDQEQDIIKCSRLVSDSSMKARWRERVETGDRELH